MRTVLVCLALGLAMASAMEPFRSGKTYTYGYRTQISSTLLGSSPSEIQQRSATQLRSQIRIQFLNDRHLKIQMENLQIGDLNEELPSGHLIRSEKFQQKDIPREMMEKLELPFGVQLIDGSVERMNFQDEDSVWSKNIKRAVVNMLQWNLKQNDVQGLQVSQTEENQNVFSLPEITLEGECVSTYSLQKTSGKQNGRFNVTKTVDFDKCQKTSDVHFGYSSTPAAELQCLKCIQQQPQQSQQQKLQNCQSECQTNVLHQKHSIERSTVSQCEMSGNPQKYGIERCQVVSSYVTKGRNPATQNTIAQILSVSELIFKSETEEKIRSFTESKTEESLMYSAEWDINEKRFYMYGDEEFEKNSPFQKVQKKVESGIAAVRQIVAQWEDKEMGYEMTAALKFNRFVQTIRQCSMKELQQMESELEKEGEHSKTLFYDALAAAATRNSLQRIAEMIQKKQISEGKAVELIKLYSLNQHSPSDRQTDILLKIAEYKGIGSVLKQTAQLAFGSSINKICQPKPAESFKQSFNVEELCSNGKKENYAKTLLLQWKNAESMYEKILSLKTIGNAGLEQTMEELQKIIVSKSEPTLIRMESIDALRRLRLSLPQRIQQILLPLYENQREQPEIRMAAFSMLLFTQPESALFDQIVFTAKNDRSQNVRSFVLTAIESLSKSPVVAEQKLSQHLKASLQIAEISDEEMRSSRKYRVPIYVSEEPQMESWMMGLAAMVSPSNALPIHLSALLQLAQNEQSAEEKFQVYFTQKNLEQWYQRMSEYLNSEEDNEEEKESIKAIGTIYNSLGLKSRRNGAYYLSSSNSQEEEEEEERNGEETPFGMMVIRCNEMDEAIIPIHEHSVPQFVRDLLKGKKPSLNLLNHLYQSISESQKTRKHIGMNMAEQKTKIPTTSGLPLALIWETSVIGSVEMEFKMNNGMELKGRLSGMATHSHKTEVWTPVVATGVNSLRTVEITLPFHLKAQMLENEIKLTAVPSEQSHRLIGVHTLPATYTQLFHSSSRTYGEPRLRSVRNWRLESTEREYHISEQRDRVFRIEANVHKVSSVEEFLQAIYSTQNDAHIYYKPTENSPRELTLTFGGFAFQKSSQHKRPETKQFFEEYESKFDEENEELQTENESQRQRQFSTFAQKYSSKNSYEHQLRVVAKARTPQKTYKAEAQFEGICDSRLQHCKLSINAQRSPLRHETENWTLEGKIQTVAAENLHNEEKPEEKQSRMYLQFFGKWGAEKKSELKGRLIAEPTKKTFWDSEVSDKWSRFLNKFNLHAEYRLQSQTKNGVERLYELVKAAYFWNLNVEGRRGEEGKIYAQIVVDPIRRRQMNFTLQTPNERVSVQNVEMPWKLQKIPQLSLASRPSNYHSIGQIFQSMSQSAECRADERRVRTFDGVAYKAPLSNCWSVLAKDCSSETPRFVVMMKKNGEENKIKMITRRNVIEVEKTESEKLQIKIDGQKIEDLDELSARGIEHTGYQVYINKPDISVRFDGQEAKVQLSGSYKNLQCGLCGHYSEETEDEFQMGNNKPTRSLKEFHRSYTLKNQECQNLDKFYREAESNEFQTENRRRFQTSFEQSDEEKWMNSSEEEDKENKKPIERTHVIEYNHKLCFSTKPVKGCPKGTQADEEAAQTPKQVEFFCLERSSPEARRLLRQTSRDQIVDSGDNKPSFFDTIQQPTKCLSRFF